MLGDYFHIHEAPSGRLEAVYYNDPGAAHITGKEIVRREGEDWGTPESLSPDEYRCDVCRNWGNGVETVVHWRPVHLGPVSQIVRDNSTEIPVDTPGCGN